MDRVAAFLDAPAGRAFLAIAEHSGLSAGALARPEISQYVAAAAVEEVGRWRMDRPTVLAALSRLVPRLRALARGVALSPATEWWFRPIEFARQLWLSSGDAPPAADRMTVPHAPPDTWERYAQKPAGGFFTSTETEGTSALHAVLAYGTGDFPGRYEASRRALWALRARADARVFEIDGPTAWHTLCLRYPAQADDGRLTPDWSCVKRDWDGVHATLGGVLLAEQVRVESEQGWTQFDGWDFEQTLWLRWVFEDVTPRADLPRELRMPDPIRVPDWARLAG